MTKLSKILIAILVFAFVAVLSFLFFTIPAIEKCPPVEEEGGFNLKEITIDDYYREPGERLGISTFQVFQGGTGLSTNTPDYILIGSSTAPGVYELISSSSLPYTSDTLASTFIIVGNGLGVGEATTTRVLDWLGTWDSLATTSFLLTTGNFFGTWDGLATSSFLLTSGNFLGTWDSFATNTLPYISSTLTKGNFLIGNGAGIAESTSTVFQYTGNIGIGTTTAPLKFSVIGGGTIDLLQIGNIISTGDPNVLDGTASSTFTIQNIWTVLDTPITSNYNANYSNYSLIENGGTFNDENITNYASYIENDDVSGNMGEMLSNYFLWKNDGILSNGYINYYDNTNNGTSSNHFYGNFLSLDNNGFVNDNMYGYSSWVNNDGTVDGNLIYGHKMDVNAGGATNAYGFYSDVSEANNNWAFYAQAGNSYFNELVSPSSTIDTMYGDLKGTWDGIATTSLVISSSTQKTLFDTTTASTSPDDTDKFAFSGLSLLRHITWANIKASLKTYFDTLYGLLSGFTMAGDINMGSNDIIAVDEMVAASSSINYINLAGSGLSASGTIPIVIASSSLDVYDLSSVHTPECALTILAMECKVNSGTSIVVILTDGSNALDTMTCGTSWTFDDGTIANSTFNRGERVLSDFGTNTGGSDRLEFYAKYKCD